MYWLSKHHYFSLFTLTILSFIALFLFCNRADVVQTIETDAILHPNETHQPNSVYKITVTAGDIDTIGPVLFGTDEKLVISVPEGYNRKFSIERYNENWVLTDTGYEIIDINSGHNHIKISLIPIADSISDSDSIPDSTNALPISDLPKHPDISELLNFSKVKKYCRSALG